MGQKTSTKNVLLYHPGKTNVVEDALNRKSMVSSMPVQVKRKELVRELHQLANLGVRLVDSDDSGFVVQNVLKSSFI
ncbi:hypothetical protein RND71_014102 [Anisodus tanguticus]|uniref:Uncharacterized protein n=1 Tax=Anisodus tanguticus TaxID=243964 RepID=A0AAE1SAS2_9SOLA|nr:hypothetical protein RND71_014102 [Anisodus tanguticus]